MAAVNKVKFDKDSVEFFTSENGSNTTRSKFTAGSSEFSFAGANNAAVTLKNIAQPTVDSDAATKKYVDDNAINGVQWKASVRAASTTSFTLALIGSGSQIDGVTLADGDRFLLKDQTDSTENGIYVIQSGSAPTRASDLPANSNAKQVAVFVEEGLDHADMGFVCTNNEGSDEVSVDDLDFTQFTALGQITAGNGLSKSSETLSVNVDDSTIEIDNDTLRIKDLGVSTAKLAAGAVTTAKLADGAVTSDKLDTDIEISGTLDVTGIATLATGSSVGTLTLADGSITDSSGAISFGDENLTTTGTLGCGDLTCGDLTADSGSSVGTLTLADGSITDSSGAIAFGSNNLSTTGNFEAGEITCSSDARLKTDIHTITNGLEVVNSLRAVTWKWKPELNMGDHKLAGVVAQEAKAQISHAVRGTKDHLRVDYNSLTGYLISAIHGLSKQVDDLKAQLH